MGVAVGEAAHPPFGARAGHHVPPSRPASSNRPITIVTSRRSRFTVPRCMCIRNRNRTCNRKCTHRWPVAPGKLHGGLLLRHLGDDRQLNACGGAARCSGAVPQTTRAGIVRLTGLGGDRAVLAQDVATWWPGAGGGGQDDDLVRP